MFWFLCQSFVPKAKIQPGWFKIICDKDVSLELRSKGDCCGGVSGILGTLWMCVSVIIVSNTGSVTHADTGRFPILAEGTSLPCKAVEPSVCEEHDTVSAHSAESLTWRFNGFWPDCMKNEIKSVQWHESSIWGFLRGYLNFWSTVSFSLSAHVTETELITLLYDNPPHFCI